MVALEKWVPTISPEPSNHFVGRYLLSVYRTEGPLHGMVITIVCDSKGMKGVDW